MPRRTKSPTSISDPVTAWAKDVLAGKLIAGPHVRNSCRRHLDDLEHGPARGLRWDITAAMRAIEFFPDILRLAGGQFEGKPFELHPSQKFKTGSLFGWKRADGSRRFRRAYVEEGKGNGKSPWAAGIGLYCLLADDEARAEVYAAASIKAQAMVLFKDAVAMWQQSQALVSRLTPSGGNPIWNLADLKTGSFFRPLSSDEAISGPRPSCALCDEIHEHPNGNVIEMLERGFKFRRQPLLVMITNSGSDRNSICFTEHGHAVRVAAGETIDDSQFSFVCSLDEHDDPLEDPTCWAKANPLLDTILTREYLAGVVEQAKAIPGKLNGILRLHFCVWTDAATAWISRRTLETVLADFDPEQEEYEEVHSGADLSAFRDLTALAFCAETGVNDEGKPTYDAWVEAWTPEETLQQRALEDKAPYDQWVKDGHLKAVPGNTIDFTYLAKHLSDLQQVFRIGRVAYDRYAFLRFEQACTELGLELDFIEHPQGGKRRARPPEAMVEAAKQTGAEPPLGLWMPGSLNELEKLMLERRIRIRRSPVLISAMMSAAIETDAFENRWFRKTKSTQRIDPVVALAMVIGAVTMTAVPSVPFSAAAMVA